MAGMTVPRYEGSTVQNAAVAVPQAQAPGADAFGAGLGQGLAKLGNVGLEIAKEEQTKSDLTALNQAKITFTEQKQKVIDGYTDPQGQFVPGLSQATGTEAVGLEKKYREKHADILGQIDLKASPAAAQLFNQWAQTELLSATSSLNKHEGIQKTASAINSTESMLKTFSDKAVQDYLISDDFDISQVIQSANSLADLKKLDPESRSRLVKETTSSVYRGIVETGLQSDDPAAAGRTVEFFDGIKALMTKADLSAVDNTVKNYKDVTTGAQVGGDVYAEGMKGITVNDAPPEGKMIDAIDSRADLNDTQKKLAKAALNDKVGRWQKDKTFMQESLANQAHGAPTYSEGMKLVAKAKGVVDDQARDSIADALDHKFKITETKNKVDAEAKQARQLSQLGNLLTFQNDYAAGKYGKLDATSLKNSQAKFGQFTDNAMQFVNSVNNDMGKAKVTNDQMNDTIRTLRFNPQLKGMLPDPDSKSDRGKMALLQGRVMDLMNAAQDKPGKTIPLDRAVILATQSVVTDEGWFSDTKEPLYLLDAPSATGNPGAVKDPAKWPKKTQDAYIDQQYALKNHGKLPTPEVREKLRWALSEGQ